MKNLIKNLLRESLLKEVMSDDFEELYLNMPRELFQAINTQNSIKFALIPKDQYHKALQEFMRYGQFMRFPERIILQWKDLLIENILKLNGLTDIHGHSSDFPYDEFYDVFDYDYETGEDGDGEFSRWLKQRYEETGDEDYNGKYNFTVIYEFLDEVKNIDNYTPQFTNGHHVLSDFATQPLMKLAGELDHQTNPNEIIVTINRILDVTHQRSDIAEIFIEGGSASLSYISNT